MPHFLNFTRADGAVTEGVNLDLVMSWRSDLTEDREPCLILCFAVMGQDATRSEIKPWVMRLTGAEREQCLRALAALGRTKTKG